MSGPFVARPPGAALYLNFAAATAGTLIKSGPGSPADVVINTGAIGTISLYDSLSASGQVIAVISTAAPIRLSFGVAFATGLFAVVTGSGNSTITYS
jgi:hypothetical protein